MSEITNPYNPGHPVANPAWLFGRQDAVDWIEMQLQAQARVMLLSAQPYIGKTSLVKQLGALPSLESFYTLVSLPEGLAAPEPGQERARSRGRNRDQEPITLARVLTPFFEQFLPQLAMHHLISAERAAAGLPPTATALRHLVAQVGPSLTKPLLLAIDDLHFLVDEDMAGLATFLSAFMPLLDECPQLFLIFTINQEKLQQIHHPLLENAPTFNLTTLNPNDSINMMTLPVKNILRFDYGITRRIVEVNSHHPYFLALFGHTLLKRQGHDGWVNQRDYDAALAEILDSALEPFQEIWDQSSWVERAVLAGIAAMQGKHGPVMQQEVIRFLQAADSNVVPEVVIHALHKLASRGVLVPMGAISYRFHVELLRLWLREHTTPADILKEVDWPRLAAQIRLNPKPDRAVPPPIVSRGRQPRLSRRRLFFAAMMALFGLGCVLAIGGVLVARSLELPLTALLPNPFVAGTDQPPELPVVEAALPLAGETELAQNEAVTFATPEPTPLPTPTPALVMARTLPSIAYMARDIDQTWQIYVMNADGSAKTPLSEQGLDDTSPVWSPDGRSIALVSRRDGNREIYIMDVETRDAVNVTRHPADDWTPAWSPDGRQLAFSSIREGRWEIFTLDTACFALPDTCRDSLRQITFDGNGNISPVWSPDGSRFAFNSKASGNWDIYTMATDGSDIRPVTTAPENDLSPVWSPDGSLIAFESNREGNVEIFIVDSNGTTPARNLTNLAFADDHGPTWSPDGQSLVFYSNREGNWDIFSTSLDGQSVVNLSQTPSRDEQTPAWRP